MAVLTIRRQMGSPGEPEALGARGQRGRTLAGVPGEPFDPAPEQVVVAPLLVGG